MFRTAFLSALISVLAVMFAWIALGSDSEAPAVGRVQVESNAGEPCAENSIQMQNVAQTARKMVAAKAKATAQDAEPVAKSRLFGRVVDVRGAGVSGATVHVVVKGLNRVGRQEYKSVAAVDGSFAVEILGRGSLWVSVLVEHDSFAAVTSARTVYVREAKLDWGNISVVAGGTILGLVSGDGGELVTDAEVSLFALHPGPRLQGQVMRPVAVAVADSVGCFTLSRVPAGTYRLTAMAPGHARCSLEPITVVDARCERLEPIKMALGYSLTGVIRQSNGRVIEGALVQLQGGGSFADDVCRSDEDGQFCFTSLRSGSYSVDVQASGFSSTTVRDIEVARGDRANVTLFAGVAIGGTVVDSVTGNPVRSYDAVLRRIGAEGGEQHGCIQRVEGSRQTGEFRFADVDAGIYTVEIVSAEHAEHRTAHFDARGGSDSIQQIHLQPGYSVRGRIDVGEAVLPLVRVELRPVGAQGGGVRLRWVRADANGEFRIPNVAAGQYRLKVSAAGFVSKTTPPFTACQQSPLVAVRLDPQSSLSGFVAGIPAGNSSAVRVLAWSSRSNVHRVLVEANGSYSIAGLAPGTYRVRACVANSMRSVLQDIVRGEGSGVDVNVRGTSSRFDPVLLVPRSESVHGYLRIGGRFAMGHKIELEAVDGARVDAARCRTSVDQRGQFTLKQVAFGQHTLIVFAADGEVHRQSIDVEPGRSELPVLIDLD